MRKGSIDQEYSEPSDDPKLWKVEPGIAIGILHLGTPRHELIQTLKDHNFEVEVDTEELDEPEFYVMEMDTTLYFGAENPFPLELIEVDDERVRFGTLKVLWDFPHNIFSTIPSSSTLWFDDLSQITSAYTYSSSASQQSFTDEQLLDSGILWMTTLGVGFKLTQGKITTLYLCDPSRLPNTGYGEFTGAQRHLSERVQIDSFKAPVAKSHPLERIAKIALLITALSVAAYFGKQAWQEQNRWENSPEVEAEVVAVWPPPPEPFPSKFQLAFQDKSGVKHEVELDQNDVYGTPQVGQTVSLRYLPESPKTVKGPSKVHDIAFDQFVPYLLGTFAVYFVLHFVSDFVLGRLLPIKRS